MTILLCPRQFDTKGSLMCFLASLLPYWNSQRVQKAFDFPLFYFITLKFCTQSQMYLLIVGLCNALTCIDVQCEDDHQFQARARHKKYPSSACNLPIMNEISIKDLNIAMNLDKQCINTRRVFNLIPLVSRFPMIKKLFL